MQMSVSGGLEQLTAPSFNYDKKKKKKRRLDKQARKRHASHMSLCCHGAAKPGSLVPDPRHRMPCVSVWQAKEKPRRS